MNKVLKYFKESTYKPFSKQIRVYGWQKEYDYTLVSSIVPFLFESFNVITNLAPKTNENRPGKIMPKFYITVHDTGDSAPEHTAQFWSETVKNQYWSEGPYHASFQYVVGNDGIYHQIPDNEVAWHAGDGTRFDYTLYDTMVDGTNKHPVITISDKGYYMIDGKTTCVLAPRAFKEYNGKTIFDRIPKTSDLNDDGILCKLIGKRYYIGETYFNQTYEKIANRCGNNNSIGIESCINEETDIYYTWQKTAKLVAHLMNDNNLSLDDVKQHHYFSGKNCPQTMRMNNLWNHFKQLVMVEYDILQFINEGYKISFIPLSNGINELGRITDNTLNAFKYKIITNYQGKTEEDIFEITM